jgi:hypothetical protein
LIRFSASLPLCSLPVLIQSDGKSVPGGLRAKRSGNRSRARMIGPLGEGSNRWTGIAVVLDWSAIFFDDEKIWLSALQNRFLSLPAPSPSQIRLTLLLHPVQKPAHSLTRNRPFV